MQKFPEAPDRKSGDAGAKRPTPSSKERNLFSFSSNRRSDNTKIFLAAGGRPNVSVFRRGAG